MSATKTLELVPFDGADEDGGTLYVLYDAGKVVQAASWPGPLEAWARDNGYAVVRSRRGRDQ